MGMTAAWIYVIIQVLLPLSYYFGSDRYNEAYAWRMYSETGMAMLTVHWACKVAEGQPEIPLTFTDFERVEMDTEYIVLLRGTGYFEGRGVPPTWFYDAAGQAMLSLFPECGVGIAMKREVGPLNSPVETWERAWLR